MRECERRSGEGIPVVRAGSGEPEADVSSKNVCSASAVGSVPYGTSLPAGGTRATINGLTRPTLPQRYGLRKASCVRVHALTRVGLRARV